MRSSTLSAFGQSERRCSLFAIRHRANEAGWGMKRVAIFAVCLLGALSVSTAATATDELPEIGRCIKVAGAASHRYANAACTTVSKGEDAGRYEWESGPGPKRGFTATAEASELETVGKVSIDCHAGSAQGEFTGPRSDEATITFTGCEYGAPSGTPCQTPGSSSGEIVTSALEGGIGFVSGGGTSKPVVGLRLAPASGTQFAAVECSGITVTLTGAVIGELTSGSTDRMLLSSSLKFKASLGRQAPTQLENGAVSVLSTNSGTESEQAGLTATETTTSEEPLEVRAIP
jgi:hypothetical protein